jgi:hypothetical protein
MYGVHTQQMYVRSDVRMYVSPIADHLRSQMQMQMQMQFSHLVVDLPICSIV